MNKSPDSEAAWRKSRIAVNNEFIRARMSWAGIPGGIEGGFQRVLFAGIYDFINM